MTNPALAALTQRRADIADMIMTKEKEIEGLRADLIHLDRSIQMLDPQANPEDIAPRQRFPRKTLWFGRGEISQIIYCVLGKAKEPVSAIVIVESAMQEKGFDPGRDRKLRQDFYQRFIVQLNALRRRGRVEAVGRSKGVKWRLARQPARLGRP